MSKQNIENYQNQIQNLLEEIQELEQQLQQQNDDIQSKDEAIQKASVVIQMLREDLEKSVEDLQKSENERDQYKKNWKESQKQLNNLNSSRLKQDMEQQVRQFSSREKELQLKFEDEKETNKLLQSQIDEMQNEIDILTQKNKSYQKDFQQIKQQLKQYESNEVSYKEKIEYKESQLTDKLLQITNLKQSITELESYYQNEISLLKKVIESQNKFKFTPINKTSVNSAATASFQNDKSNTNTPRKMKDGLSDTLDQSFANRNTMSQKKPLTKKRSISQQNQSQRKFNSHSMSNLHIEERSQLNSTINNTQKLNKSLLQKYDSNNNENNDQEYKQLELKVKLLESELQDSLDREKQVIEQFERIVANETQRVLDYSQDIFDKEVTIRPEVERYLMMIEELKQRLEDSSSKAITLTSLVRDSQIIQRLTMKSLIESKIMFDTFVDKLEQHINLIEIEFITLTKDSRETIHLKSYQEIKQCMGRVRSLIIEFNQEKQNEIQELITQNSKETNRQLSQQQGAQRVETLEKENLLVSEAYKQIKEILEDKGEYYSFANDSDSTPQKQVANFNANESSDGRQNNNNYLLMKNSDSDQQQITFEGRIMSSQNQQTQGDQIFDFTMHQNLIRRLHSLQEKVKQYEKILDEKFALEKSQKNTDDYFQRRLDDLEEEKLFFQVEREKYLLEKDQLIQKIIEMENQLMQICQEMSECNNNNNNTSSQQILSGSSRQFQKIPHVQLSSGRDFQQFPYNKAGGDLEKELQLLQEQNSGLRLEIEQIVIDMKEQQEKITKQEEENQQSLALIDQTLLDLEEAIKQKEAFQLENNQLKDMIGNYQKIIDDHRSELSSREFQIQQKFNENLDELQKYKKELNDKEMTIGNLKKKLEENESIMQDYIDIIASFRTKSDDERNFSYKQQIENILSLLTKSLEQYSTRQNHNFISKYQAFLEENYALFQEKISSLISSIFHGYHKINSAIGNNATSLLSSSIRFKNKSPRQIRNDYLELKNLPDQLESKNEYIDQKSTQLNDNNKLFYSTNSNLHLSIPASLDDVEQQCQKYTAIVIENLIRRESDSNVKVNVMKFCRMLNEVAEQLIINANNSDDVIINKLQRLFDDNKQKNIVIVEFQLQLFQILKSWKNGLLQQSEVFYQLSFYLKSQIEEKDQNQPTINGGPKKPDIQKHISILSSNEFFNSVLEKIKAMDQNLKDEQDNSISDLSNYQAYKKKLQQLVKQGVDTFLESIENMKDKMLIERKTQTILFSLSNLTEKSFLTLLEQFSQTLQQFSSKLNQLIINFI